MKKEKKMQLAKFSIAKINNLELKGGVVTYTCGSIECITEDCTSFVTTCRTTTGSRSGGSL